MKKRKSTLLHEPCAAHNLSRTLQAVFSARMHMEEILCKKRIFSLF
jgi:hypothetical protein